MKSKASNNPWMLDDINSSSLIAFSSVFCSSSIIKKSSAMLQIIIFIMSFFSVSVFSTALASRPALAAGACCEKTKDGSYCTYTDESSCDPNFKSAFASCENTYFCQAGCCNVGSEGKCYENSPRSLCESKEGTFGTDKSCNSVSQCQKGCCQLSNECFFVTQTQCKLETGKYPNLVMQFAQSDSEEQCISSCLSQEQGCCVQAGECKYTTRTECNLASAVLVNETKEGFYKGVFCSNDKLNCQCTKHQKKGCLSGKEDVYWFDSCGNSEDVAEDCDYASGTLCGEDSGEFKCKNINCAGTTRFESTEGTGVGRANGESWCVYDGDTGLGVDLVGSRHYKVSCLLGEEIIEECKDFREDICIQGQNEKGFLEAQCRPNRWQDCNDQKNKKSCENTDLRDCFWMGDKCVPHVPPGFRFWEGEGSDRCAQANDKEKFPDEESVPQDWVNLKGAECRAQGDCGNHFNIVGRKSKDGFTSSHKEEEESKFEDFKKGWMGKLAMIGLPFLGSNLLSKENVPYTYGLNLASKKLAGLGKVPYLDKRFPELGTPLPSTETLSNLKTKIADLNNLKTKDFLEFKGDEIKNAKELLNIGDKEWSELNSETFEKLVGDKIGTFNKELTTVEELASQSKLFISKALNILGWIFIAYTIIELIRSLVTKEKEITATISCSTWQAPRGGSDCELCNKREPFGEDGKPLRKCTEYACKSLGAGCSLINEGSGNETCVYIASKDVNSPIIEPWTDVLPKDFSIKETTEKGLEGYSVVEAVEPFMPIVLGIKTNEPSQCKAGIQQGIPFNDMTNFFGDNLYDYGHSIFFALPGEAIEEQVLELTNGGEYILFVRCSDAGGNTNAKDYFIKFKVETGPDFTPPEIVSTSIMNNGYIANGAARTPLSIYVNEPGECKWSKENIDFGAMPNSFDCPKSGLATNSSSLYECNGELNGIEDNTINKHYFRCRDMSENVMQESFEFNLVGTKELKTIKISPSGQVTSPIILTAETADGAINGESICGFSQENDEEKMVQFLETGASKHEQELVLEDGTYTYYIKCTDRAGNPALEKTTFTVFTDRSAPKIVRLYKDISKAQATLHITTNENSVCEYKTSGGFVFGTGNRMPADKTKEHEALWGGDSYYVVCQDLYNNTSPVYTIYS